MGSLLLPLPPRALRQSHNDDIPRESVSRPISIFVMWISPNTSPPINKRGTDRHTSAMQEAREGIKTFEPNPTILSNDKVCEIKYSAADNESQPCNGETGFGFERDAAAVTKFEISTGLPDWVCCAERRGGQRGGGEAC